MVSHIKYSMKKGPTAQEEILKQLEADNDVGVRFIIPDQGTIGTSDGSASRGSPTSRYWFAPSSSSCTLAARSARRLSPQQSPRPHCHGRRWHLSNVKNIVDQLVSGNCAVTLPKDYVRPPLSKCGHRPDGLRTWPRSHQITRKSAALRSRSFWRTANFTAPPLSSPFLS